MNKKTSLRLLVVSSGDMVQLFALYAIPLQVLGIPLQVSGIPSVKCGQSYKRPTSVNYVTITRTFSIVRHQRCNLRSWSTYKIDHWPSSAAKNAVKALVMQKAERQNIQSSHPITLFTHFKTNTKSINIYNRV